MKNVPPELHDELRRRAAADGKTVGELVLDAIRRDLRKAEMRDWLERIREINEDLPKISREAFDEIIAESRAERRWADDDRR